MEDWTWVWGGYGLTWIVLAVYTLYLRRRVTQARARLEALES